MNRKEIVANIKKGNLTAFGWDLAYEAKAFSTTVSKLISERDGWDLNNLATLLIIDFPGRYTE